LLSFNLPLQSSLQLSILLNNLPPILAERVRRQTSQRHTSGPEATLRSPATSGWLTIGTHVSRLRFPSLMSHHRIHASILPLTFWIARWETCVSPSVLSVACIQFPAVRTMSRDLSLAEDNRPICPEPAWQKMAQSPPAPRKACD